MNHPRIVTIDIETSPIESYTWGLWEQNVGLEQIKTEWTILSYAAKWFGEKKMIYKDTSGRGVKRVRDDKKLLEDLWTILDAADIVVAQNGKRFDMKKINARLLMHNLPPYSPVRVVDTLQVSKNHFGFTSNKLAWLSKYLTATPKSEHKKFPGFDLWLECLKDNPKAWAEMKKYNIQDVIATEELYVKLRPWITNHPNMGAYNLSPVPQCPKCASVNQQSRGTATTQQGRYTRYQCQDCGGWSRGKLMLLDLKKRRSLLA
jgi:hypothetical protein